ncbi:MAG: hypothetical protein ACP5O8_02260 [Candidatus Aenigmatarchaeota archaeon]
MLLICVPLPSSVAAYFSRKFLENFEKNEKYVATLIFIHPKVKENFKLLFLFALIFGISWSISIARRYVEWLKPVGSFAVVFSTYFVLIVFAHFFKTLYEITKSEEYGS